VHQVGNQPRLYYDARSTSHQEVQEKLANLHGLLDSWRRWHCDLL